MKQVRWGIIGCGDVTEVKSGPAFQKIEGSELIAVMRRNGAKAQDYARRHGVPKWYDAADSLIHDPEVDAVYVATPPSSHAEYVMNVAEVGKPVYVEKPMALNYDECQGMIKACENARVPLFVAYYRRGLATFLKAKDLVESGAIGAIRFAKIELLMPPEENQTDPDTLHWNVLPEISGGGRFVDLGCHQLDVLDYILGPIVSARGQAANQANLYPAEDIVCASFRFSSGVLGSGVWCFTISEECRKDQTEIVGTTGKITFSSFQPAPVRLENEDGIEEYDIPFPEHVQQPLIQTIVDELLGRGTCPSTGNSAARTSWVIDEILAEWRRGIEKP
jgi:predicted dehydrogenase